MKLRLYEVIERCVGEGVADGFRRAQGRAAPPSQADLEADITAAVMEQFQRWFVFDMPAGVFQDPEG